MSMSTKRSAVVSKKQPSAVPSPNQTTIQPRLLRVAEAARYLGATSWYVRTLIWSHSIAFVKFGKRHLLDVRDLDAYVDSQKATA